MISSKFYLSVRDISFLDSAIINRGIRSKWLLCEKYQKYDKVIVKISDPMKWFKLKNIFLYDLIITNSADVVNKSNTCFSDLAQQCISLSSLDVSFLYEYKLSESDLSHLLQNTPLLKKINFNSCEAFTDQILEILGKCCNQLTEIVIVSIKGETTNSGWKSLLQSCSQLQSFTHVTTASVDLENPVCYYDYSDNFNVLETSCPLLETLYLGNVNFVSTSPFTAGGCKLFTAGGCKLLKSIRLFLVIGVTDEFLSSIGFNCPLLETFILSEPRLQDYFKDIEADENEEINKAILSQLITSVADVTQITNQGIQAIIHHCPLLKEFDVALRQSGKMITDDVLEGLDSYCPLMEKIDLTFLCHSGDNTVQYSQQRSN